MFGSHLSIAGSMTNALDAAQRLGMDTVQVFTKNQQQWRAPPLKPAEVDAWCRGLARLGWEDRTVSHASYLINLASPDDDLWKRSVSLMVEEVERCEALSIPFLVHHPGAPKDRGADWGIRRIARAWKQIVAATRGYRTVACLENTVGAGSTLGRTFEELAALRAAIADAAGDPARFAYCFDTCHAHAGGYDLSDRGRAEAVLDELDRVCGLGLVRVVHMNDSVAPAGSRRDRHAHIGEGTIGRSTATRRLARSGFAAVVNRPQWRDVPKILETPKGTTPAGTPWDRLNLGRLRRICEHPDGGARFRPGGGVRTARG